MSTASLYRRVLRRETTSPRATLAIVAAIVLVLASAYALLEIVLAALGQPPLLAAPVQWAAAVPLLTTVIPAVLAIAGVVVAVIGLLLIIAAFRAGRRHRHVIATDRVATVVDDEVIASAVARTAALEAGVSPDNTRVSVSRRRAVVRLTPASGTPVNATPVTAAAADRLQSFDLRPAVKARVAIQKGRPGS